jgi:hypothetical protein
MAEPLKLCPSFVRPTTSLVASVNLEGSGATIVSGATETPLLRDGLEYRVFCAVSSSTTPMNIGAGWTDLGSYNGAGGGRMTLAVSGVADAITGTPAGNITTGSTWGTAGGLRKTLQVAGSDARAACSATTGSGSGTTMTAPSAAAPSRPVRVLRFLIASGTSAPTPGAPSSYGGENYAVGSSTLGTDYSWCIVDDGVYLPGAAIPAITSSLSSSRAWLAATVLVPLWPVVKPVAIASASTTTTFASAGSFTGNPYTICGMTSGAVTPGDGAVGRAQADDVMLLMLCENNGGNFSASPPTQHTILAGPWTGGDRANAGQGIVYLHTATGPTWTGGTITYSANGTNYTMNRTGVAFRGVDSVSVTSYGPTQAPVSGTDMVAPDGTVDRAGSIGIYYAVQGGVLQDTFPSFSGSQLVRRELNGLAWTNSGDSRMRFQVVYATELPAGTWSPPFVVQTANNPRNYAAATIVLNVVPVLVTFEAVAELDVDASADNWLAESGTAFEAVAELYVDASASFAVDRRRRKPKREFVYIYDAHGRQQGVIVN